MQIIAQSLQTSRLCSQNVHVLLEVDQSLLKSLWKSLLTGSQFMPLLMWPNVDTLPPLLFRCNNLKTRHRHFLLIWVCCCTRRCTHIPGWITPLLLDLLQPWCPLNQVQVVITSKVLLEILLLQVHQINLIKRSITDWFIDLLSLDHLSFLTKTFNECFVLHPSLLSQLFHLDNLLLKCLP